MFHTLSASAVVTELTSDERLGLTSDEARARLTTYGPNLLPEAEKKHWLAVLFGYFKDFLMVILMIAALISFLVGDVKDAVVILLIVVANALMGFFQESKADNAIAALKKLSVAKAKVIRNGQTLLLDAKDVVPGDVLILETGDKIPADARLLESIQLKIAESALTGESKPVQKDQAFISQANVSIGDRLNMVYKDTVVLYGRGKAVVTATGIATEMGKISQLLQHEDQKTTPLNSELNTLGKKLTIFAAAVAILIFFIILFLDPSQVKNAFLTSVSMAIAVVPEGIPAVVTTVLAISVARLARKRAIVRKLSAVETLGAASCILTDKTGTLTKNEMTVSDLFVPGRDLQWQQEAWVENGQKVNPHTDPALRQLIYCAILCNDASLSDTQVLGDPTEACLITMARQAGFDINKIRSEHQRLFELPFSSETKQMTVVVRDAQQQILVFTKGASEVVSGYLTQSLPTYAAAAEQMARGLAEAATPARAVPRIHASHDLALALLPARMAK
ncbi:HAD-IC family P-type ATPase, partial [Patescibacteria group bacterium]|nr:HAD-IC family P-type ATPase [Patescibacteria group bacterium]